MSPKTGSQPTFTRLDFAASQIPTVDHGGGRLDREHPQRGVRGAPSGKSDVSVPTVATVAAIRAGATCTGCP
jgi:hypothetical protein